jgi:hypothetical protein
MPEFRETVDLPTCIKIKKQFLPSISISVHYSLPIWGYNTLATNGVIKQDTKKQNYQVNNQQLLSNKLKKNKTKLRGCSPQANYTDRETATCRRSANLCE